MVTEVPRLRAPPPESGWPPLCPACLRAPLASVRGQRASPQLSLPGHLPPGAAERAHTARAPQRPPPSPPQRPKRAPRASALCSARASARAAQLPTLRPGRPPAGPHSLPTFSPCTSPPNLSLPQGPQGPPHCTLLPARAVPGSTPWCPPQFLAAQRPRSLGSSLSTRPPSALAPLPLVCTSPVPGQEELGRPSG